MGKARVEDPLKISIADLIEDLSQEVEAIAPQSEQLRVAVSLFRAMKIPVIEPAHFFGKIPKNLLPDLSAEIYPKDSVSQFHWGRMTLQARKRKTSPLGYVLETPIIQSDGLKVPFHRLALQILQSHLEGLKSQANFTIREEKIEGLDVVKIALPTEKMEKEAVPIGLVGDKAAGLILFPPTPIALERAELVVQVGSVGFLTLPERTQN